ncbi:MAG: heavy-metal-associated domain-containing protein [Verrucomicrobiota bacterium]
MKLPLALFLGLGLAIQLSAAEVKPHPVTATFYISNVQCSTCVESIAESVKKVKSVTDFKMDPAQGYALISFDTHVSSYHQIAQSVADASPVHGDKYEATLKLSVPDYAKGDNAAKIDAVFAKQKADVTVRTVNKEKGEFVLHFLPLKINPKKEGPQGFNAGKFGHPIHDPAPKGLGLAFAIKREGAKAAPKK